MALDQTSLFRLNMLSFNVAGVLKKISNRFFHSQLYTSIRKNSELNNSVTNKKAYICALGPSLKDVDINKIKGDTIVVNRFYLIGKEFPSFVPTYYVILDYDFALEKHRADFRAALNMYLPKGTIFFLNSKLYGSPLLNGYPLDNIYFISCFDGNVKPDKRYKLDGVLPAFQNVVGSAIMVLSLLGYKQISLLGCDFNSFASRKIAHCYADKSYTKTIRLSRELFVYSIAAKQHEYLQEFALNNNIHISNSTKNSLIDAYPMEIEEDLYR